MGLKIIIDFFLANFKGVFLALVGAWVKGGKPFQGTTS
jgi:hypothetical protein